MSARARLLLIAGVLALVALAPALAPSDPMATDTYASLQPPGGAHLLGTDRLGRDVWSRLLYGGQRTVFVAGLATVIAVGVGTLLGLMAWGALDAPVSALTDALLAIPNLLLALAIITLLGAGVGSLAVATGISLVAPFARVTRGAVLAVRGLPYIESARGAGAPGWWILTRHVAPNIAPTLLAYAGVIFAYSVLNSAALSFLGLGGDLGAPDWGSMLYDGRVTFRSAPWVSAAPGLAITLLVLAINQVTGRLDARK